MGSRPGQGAVENLTNQGKGFVSQAKARAAKKAKLDGAEIARKLTSGDAAYMRGLRKRLHAGTAGPIEGLLWMLAHGKPKEHTGGADDQARIIVVREAAKKAIRESQPRRALPAVIVEAEVVKRGPADGDP